MHRRILCDNGGYIYPIFRTKSTVPPLFRIPVKNLLPTAVNRAIGANFCFDSGCIRSVGSRAKPPVKVTDQVPCQGVRGPGTKSREAEWFCENVTIFCIAEIQSCAVCNCTSQVVSLLAA